ncbi:hypothetical protein BaRGS_00037377, partial [Batillaria attramentaria]
RHGLVIFAFGLPPPPPPPPASALPPPLSSPHQLRTTHVEIVSSLWQAFPAADSSKQNTAGHSDMMAFGDALRDCLASSHRHYFTEHCRNGNVCVTHPCLISREGE